MIALLAVGKLLSLSDVRYKVSNNECCRGPAISGVVNWILQ